MLRRLGSRTYRADREKILSNTFADRLFSTEREGGILIEVTFWPHAHRKIHDVYISSKNAIAEGALKRISELYTIEDEMRGASV
ncbi:hypothetical protein WGY28_004686 [Escherichia coli]